MRHTLISLPIQFFPSLLFHHNSLSQHTLMSSITIFLLTSLFTTFYLPLHLSAMPILPTPNPSTTQTQILNRSPPATIPAFPEQSQAAACPLDLPENLFQGIKSACGPSVNHRPSPEFYSGELHRSRCCPVLAAWLYSAYSQTGLPATATAAMAPLAQTVTYDMPVLPDDSETCVDTLGKALANKRIYLSRPNSTCDVVSCFCGIRLHPFSCPEAFSVNTRGKLIGGESVKKLERDCFNGGGLGGCSKCLNSLYLLNGDKAVKGKRSNRTIKMQNRDCGLMGLTWLLNKNRSAYIHTVSAVLRAMMMNNDDSTNPKFCTLNGDGMPLAVDSSQINTQSSSTIRLHHYLLLPLFLIILFSFVFIA